MNVRLGFSPCPNDTFIFHALLHELVHSPKVRWEPHLADVETLNQWALTGRLEVTKMSFHAAAYCSRHYQLLNAGAALGFGCGPLLISKSQLTEEQVNQGVIAIPGELTTAHFLFKLAFPESKSIRIMVFSEIEEAVVRGEVDAGVIIHENRFTYADKGLIKILDLGERWEETTGLPIPLGGIFVRRDLPAPLKKEIEQAIAASVRYAWAHLDASSEYVRCHSQEMAPDVVNQHIQLYVNDYSADLGPLGRDAVKGLYMKAIESGLLSSISEDFFLP